MMENRSDFRMVISSVLNRTNFYFLPLAKLTEILKLLEMPETSEPNTILQYVFTGIVRLYQKYKQKIGSYLFNQKFNNISKESKELLYSIFLHIHSQLNTKQQNIMHSMSIPPYNMNMIYPQVQNGGFNMESPPNAYDDQMKKYLDAAKMYPYYFMNPQLGSSINPSINPTVNPSSLNTSMSAQYGMQMQMPNPYMGYPNGPSMPMPNYGQIKNTPRSIPTSGMPFGMNPYSLPGNGSMYPPQYMGPYPTAGMMGGYGQTPPPSFSHMMGLDKAELLSKNAQMSKFMPNSQIQKKYLPSQPNRFDPSQKIDRQKSLPKDPKIMPPHMKMPFNPQISSPLGNGVNKTDESKTKPGPTDFLPKKLPFKDTKMLAQPNPIYKTCACKGYFEYDTAFVCSICKNKFHYRCSSLPQKPQQIAFSEIACAHCKMRTMDPLNKVQETLGEFYLMNLTERSFQATINFKPFEGRCKDKNSKYEIEIRCIRAGEHMKNLEITWPDECQIKINNEKIVDIPALQSNSSLKKRKDYSVFITPNIYSKAAYLTSDGTNILQKMKISLQLKQLSQQEMNGKRIRNEFTFALGIYLVEKLNVDELYAKIMSEQKIEDKNFLRNLMKTKEDQVQIDKITIRLTDPYSWDFIKTPVRGHKCNHAQCFDLKTFISLMYSAKNRTWKCPLCAREARKFMLDNEQMELIKKAHEFDPIPKQVSIYKEGKVAFKIQKDSEDEDEAVSSNNNKTKKIAKQKKQQVIRQK